MKKIIIMTVSLVYMLGVVGCSSYNELKFKNTFVPTESNLIEEHFEERPNVFSTEYCELSDGTWKSGEYTYKYKLQITGRINDAEKEITYTILSNTEDITFEQAWKSSGLSSNLDDYFKIEDAVFVAIRVE